MERTPAKLTGTHKFSAFMLSVCIHCQPKPQLYMVNNEKPFFSFNFGVTTREHIQHHSFISLSNYEKKIYLNSISYNETPEAKKKNVRNGRQQCRFTECINVACNS